eukprot:scaffold67311_cov60-Phaeocystis_antarctica.AAC.4
MARRECRLRQYRWPVAVLAQRRRRLAWPNGSLDDVPRALTPARALRWRSAEPARSMRWLSADKLYSVAPCAHALAPQRWAGGRAG